MTMTAADAPAELGVGPTAALLEVEHLCKTFPITRGILQRKAGEVVAVDDISFTIERGSTLGLVGESGSGKSTTARLVLRLIEPTSGVVRFDGIDVLAAGRNAMRALRRRMQIIFQDPFSSLNPRMRAATNIAEPLRHLDEGDADSRRARAIELLERVGLRADAADKYPHQFSGGQAQRIGIARALATAPSLVVCDEAVSALDASVQAQILNLLKELQRDLGLSYLFISHDMNVVRYVADEIQVMHRGRMVETGRSATVFDAPRHPYTQELLAAVPRLEVGGSRQFDEFIVAGGPVREVSSQGCLYAARCPHAFDRCTETRPEPVGVDGHGVVRCHLVTEEAS